jgi:hypothetical protein
MPVTTSLLPGVTRPTRCLSTTISSVRGSSPVGMSSGRSCRQQKQRHRIDSMPSYSHNSWTWSIYAMSSAALSLLPLHNYYWITQRFYFCNDLLYPAAHQVGCMCMHIC